jgi:hypothetical protein
MRVRALLAGAAALVALPAPALAHEGNPDYRSVVTGFNPDVSGVEVEVLNFDDSLRLQNQSGETVTVEGYEAEPYFRIQPDGTVEVNERSPSLYLNRDRFAQVDVPDRADPEAPPQWHVESESGQFAWHDHRSHYMGEGTPPQVTDESVRTKVFDYEIPMQVGDRTVNLLGTLYWVGEDDSLPLLPFVGLGIFMLASAVVVIVIRRRRRVPGDREGKKTREAW